MSDCNVEAIGEAVLSRLQVVEGGTAIERLQPNIPASHVLAARSVEEGGIASERLQLELLVGDGTLGLLCSKGRHRE